MLTVTQDIDPRSQGRFDIALADETLRVDLGEENFTD
jgi:hypothetical protein